MARINHKGFTLVEVLLSIAFFAVLATIAVPVIQGVQTKNDAVLAANIIEQSVRRAQLLARSGARDSKWGVDVRAGSVTIFSGNSYATRSTDYDEVFTIPNDVTFSTSAEMVFEKLAATTSAQQTITTSDQNGSVITLVIATNGVVNR